ncbi:MAG: glycosyltransferase family 4 protein [Anaerovibrio sp.]|uniref:glycosyltransferase family 4 protein n=1 Tax=Anaerovibrio sp. TaxID=1872532 RepID=UPI0025BCFEF0|nr:glycosyltransferase family 4 protein [Anaerovibrio sp.]MBE6098963.1 glycosyltransferase family 4 protein [Anaerovibrio sp.]
MNVLMVGVDEERAGGMWSVAETYIKSEKFNQHVGLTYIATSTGGSALKRIKKMLIGLIQIIGVLLFQKVDVVHIHMAEKGSVFRKGLVVALAKLFGKKIAIQMHAGPIVHWYSTLDGTTQSLVRFILNSSDKLLVLGEYWKRELCSIIDERKIQVLYNGTICSNSNNYNVDGKNIVFLGMITERKGAFDLIKAVSLVDREISADIKVLMCGLDFDGKAEKYSRELHLEQRIVFVGWVDSLYKEKIFRNAMLCVLPTYFEGLSMTVIEAMAHGVPVITTNISTMPELLGRDYSLIIPGDIDGLCEQLRHMCNDKNARLKTSAYLFNRAKAMYSLEKNINSTLSIYKELID